VSVRDIDACEHDLSLSALRRTRVSSLESPPLACLLVGNDLHILHNLQIIFIITVVDNALLLLFSLSRESTPFDFRKFFGKICLCPPWPWSTEHITHLWQGLVIRVRT
jgi:hypothetical protein